MYKNIISVLLAILPIILEQTIKEKIIPVTIFYVFLLILLLPKFLKLKYDKEYLSLIMIIFVTNIFVIYYSKYKVVKENILIGCLTTIVVFFIVNGFSKINFYKFYRSYINISLFSSFLIIIQKILGILGINILYNNKYFYFLNSSNMSFYRPCGIFSEPAHYVQYILPLLFLEFERDNKNKKLIFILMIGVLSSTSSLGYIAIVILAIFPILKNINFKRIIIILISLLIIYFILDSLKEYSLAIKRTLAGSSMESRILIGIRSYERFPVFNKIFGVGTNNLISVYEAEVFYNKWGERFIFEYASTLLYISLTTGIVGAICFLKFYFKKFLAYYNVKYVRVPIILLGILILSSNIFNTYWWIFYLSIFYNLKNMLKKGINLENFASKL